MPSNHASVRCPWPGYIWESGHDHIGFRMTEIEEYNSMVLGLRTLNDEVLKALMLVLA